MVQIGSNSQGGTRVTKACHISEDGTPDFRLAHLTLELAPELLECRNMSKHVETHYPFIILRSRPRIAPLGRRTWHEMLHSQVFPSIPKLPGND